MENHYVRYLFSSTGKYVILAFFSLQILFSQGSSRAQRPQTNKKSCCSSFTSNCSIDDVRSVVHLSNRATQVIYSLTFCAISSPYFVNNNSGLILSQNFI